MKNFFNTLSSSKMTRAQFLLLVGSLVIGAMTYSPTHKIMVRSGLLIPPSGTYGGGAYGNTNY